MSDNVQLQLEQEEEEEEEEEERVEKVCKNVPGRLHGRPTDWCSSRQGGPARPVRRAGGRLCGQRGGPSCKIRHPPSLSPDPGYVLQASKQTQLQPLFTAPSPLSPGS